MSASPKSSKEDIGFVLVHGAGLAVWVWEELISFMDAPTLPAAFPARDADQSVRDDLRLVDYTDAVLEQVSKWEVSSVILVAHSIGGPICIELASRLPNRVEGFIGLSAGIPERGQSFLSCFPFHQRVVQQLVLRFAGTRPPERVIRRSLCAELNEEQADRVVSDFIPESRRLYTDPVAGDIPDVPTRYIQTTMDKSITPEQQAKMVTTLGTDDVVNLDTGHLPMVSHPGKLASTLEGFITRIQ